MGSGFRLEYDVPFISSAEKDMCSEHSMAMVAGFHLGQSMVEALNYLKDIESIKDETGGEECFNLENMDDCVREIEERNQRGLRCRKVEGATIDGIKGQVWLGRPPQIRIVPTGQKNRHTVIIVGYQEVKGKTTFRVQDQADRLGRKRDVSESDLLEQWNPTGRMALFCRSDIHERDGGE